MTNDSFITVRPEPLSTLGREIEEALLKVIKIERLCVGAEDEKGSVEDEFSMAKKELYVLIMNTKQLIRDRAELLEAEGHSVEVIKKSSIINSNNEQMLPKFQTMKDLFKKDAKKRDKEEMDQRFEELQLIKKQIEECKDLAKNASAYPPQKVTQMTDFIKQMDEAGAAPPPEFDNGGQGWREPTAEEQAVVSRWQARDKGFDAKIFQVGEGVDKLTQTAENMGAKIQQQTRLAIDLSRQADEANMEVVKINEQMKSLINSGSGLNLCCKLLLTIVLICLISYIIQNVTNRIKKGVSGSGDSDGSPASRASLYDIMRPVETEYRWHLNFSNHITDSGGRPF